MDEEIRFDEDKRENRIDSESLRLLLGYENKTCKYSDSVFYCVIHVIEDAVLKESIDESNTAFNLSLRCFLKLFQDLALIDHIKILPRVVNIFKLSATSNCVEKQLRVCETLIDLVESKSLRQRFGKWREIITANLVVHNVDIFGRIKDLFGARLDDDFLSNRRAMVCVDLITCLVKQGHHFKEHFNKNFNLENLIVFLRRIKKISRNVIDSLFRFLVNGDWAADSYCGVIANGDVACVLIDILPSLSLDLQRYVCESLRVMCATINHNRIISCQSGAIGNIIQLLNRNKVQLSKQILSCLISLLEILGSLSITPQQLKQLIGLFRTNKERKQISFSDRLLQAMERMASQVDDRQPRYFIDLYDPTEAFWIKGPLIHKCNGKGITFQAWICLDFSLSSTKHSRLESFKARYMLYSFLNSTGEGFEAFFTETGFLVVAVCTKKEYLTVSMTDLKFDDQDWHSLSVAHTKKSFGSSLVTIFVDGQLFHQAPIKYPVTEGLIHTHIGYGVRHNPNFYYNIHHPPAPAKLPKSFEFPDCIAAGQQNNIWGQVHTLKGQISSVRMFSESLSPSVLSDIHSAGPSNWSNGNLSDVSENQSHLNDLLKNVVFHYDAKAAYDNLCINLAVPSNDQSFLKNNLSGRLCHVWDIKSSIQCIGGLQVLFPLLEQVQYSDAWEGKIERDHSMHADKEGDAISTKDISVDSNFDTHRPTKLELSTSPFDFNHFGNVVRVPSTEAFITVKSSEKTEKTSQAVTLEECDREEKPSVSDGTSNYEQNKNHSSAGSFLVIESRESPVSPKREYEDTDEWVLVDKSSARARNLTFSRWATDKDLYNLNGATYFISLMRNMLMQQKSAQELFLHSKGFQLMGLLLQRCDPRIINVGFLMSLQSLVESLVGSQEQLLESIYQYIVFDFRIWTVSDISLRTAHVQLISTYIKDNPKFFRENFGVGFIIKVIRSHYLQPTKSKGRENSVKLVDEDRKCIRVALLGLVSFYLKSDCLQDDIEALISYVSALTDLEHLTEAVELLKHMMEIQVPESGRFLSLLSASNCVNILTRWLVHDGNEKIRLDILKIFHLLLTSNKVSEAAKSKVRLNHVGYDSLCILMSKQSISRDVIVALLKLAISPEQTAYRGVDVYVHFDIIFGTLTMLQTQPIPVKLEVALKIRNSLKSSKTSARFCIQEAAWYEPLLQLIVVQSENEAEISSEPDVMLEELSEVTLEIIHLAMWKGIDGSDVTVWKERGQPLAALHQMASRHVFIMPVLAIERKLLAKCVRACCQALNESVQPWAVDNQNSVQVIKLVEDFLLSTEFTEPTDTTTLQKWNIELLESLHELLNAMNAWEDSIEGGSEWTEALHIVERILYACAVFNDIKFISYAAKRLHKMLARRKITSHEEACYEMSCLNNVYKNLRQRDDNSHSLFVSVFRLYFERFHEMLNTNKHLPDLPSLDLSTHVFEETFPEFFTRGQYVHFASQVDRIARNFKDNRFASTSIDIARFWMDCLSTMDAAVKQRSHRTEESLQNFSRFIYTSFDETRNTANVEQNEFETYQNYDLSTTNRLWEDKKKLLTSERGAWSDQNLDRTFWKLSSVENSSRMRLKLIRNFDATDHADASSARDQRASDANMPESLMNININIPAVEEFSELVLSGEEDDEDVEDGKELREPTGHLYDLNPVETTVGKVKLTIKCQLVTLMDLVPGTIELTSSFISFYEEANDSLFGSGFDFRFSLKELREMHMRRYNLRKSALEFFLDDKSSYFINFIAAPDRDRFFKKTTSQRPPNLYYSGIKSPQKLLRVSHLTQRWVRREITNFDYLMQLNTIAGRTYNDLAQYPVFPWVLADYESDELDLNNPAVYRDLSRPIGALNPKRLGDLQERFKNCVDPNGFQFQCHYLTHYSNAAVVLHYLLRIEPFTSLHIDLQGEKFDVADRQFYSIGNTWKALHDGSGDIRELIPEFYCFPEFLLNINRLDLGRLQSGPTVDNVLLPNWASSVHDFIYKHKLALESEYVSSNLHDWIDLIFGYKQKGEEAVKAYNVFHHYSYEGSVDLDSISDPKDRDAIEGIINNFGQTPCQLLTKPHPMRKSAAEMANEAPRVLDTLHDVNCSLLKINPDGSPFIFIATQEARQRSLLNHGMSDPLITVDQNGYLGCHGWLPFSEDSNGSFAFSLDSKFTGKISKSQNSLPRLPGAWSPLAKRSSQLFALTPDGKLLICCGFWDNSVRVLNSKGKILSSLYQHLDIVTCLSLDPSGHYFITGSCDTMCMVWRIAYHAGVSSDVIKQPLQTLYGHDDAVTTVAMVWELDLAVSGSKDGSCIIHTIKKGQFIKTIRPDPLLMDSSVSIVCLTKYGRIIVNSSHYYKEEVDNILSVYSINGEMIVKLNLSEAILDMLVIEEKLVTGGERGTLAIRDVYKIETPIIAKNLQLPIHTVAVTPDGSHIFAGRNNGTVVVIGP